MSATGILTMSFSKPIVVPPIRIDSNYKTYQTNSTRMLKSKYSIKEIVGFKVYSERYDEESEETSIKDYYLTRLNEQGLDI